MAIAAELHSAIPRLAWLCERAAGSGEIRLHHGSGVDVGPDFFFEGRMGRRFREKGLHRAAVLRHGGAGRR